MSLDTDTVHMDNHLDNKVHRDSAQSSDYKLPNIASHNHFLRSFFCILHTQLQLYLGSKIVGHNLNVLLNSLTAKLGFCSLLRVNGYHQASHIYNRNHSHFLRIMKPFFLPTIVTSNKATGVITVLSIRNFLKSRNLRNPWLQPLGQLTPHGQLSSQSINFRAHFLEFYGSFFTNH